MNDDGYIVIENAINDDLLSRLRVDLDVAEQKEWQQKTKANPRLLRDGTIHHLPYYAASFIEFLDDQQFHEAISTYICGAYTVNVYNGVIKKPAEQNYTDQIHRDIRFYSHDVNLSLNMLVMVDEFTSENGATQVLPGSHKNKERPSDEEFLLNSTELVGSAGTVVLFNSNLWHRGGVNKSEKVRRAITITFTHHWLKPQIDFCKLLKIHENKTKYSEHLLQILGYYARVPESLEHWFLPESERFYRNK